MHADLETTIVRLMRRRTAGRRPVSLTELCAWTERCTADVRRAVASACRASRIAEAGRDPLGVPLYVLLHEISIAGADDAPVPPLPLA